MVKETGLDTSEIIQMALSDKVSFEAIFDLYNLTEDQVKKLMKKNIKRGSYMAWRNRVLKKPKKIFEKHGSRKKSF